jgi:hypothetical protein
VTVITSDIKQIFIDIAKKLFFFLVNSHGFDGPNVSSSVDALKVAG